ncbi:MAG TPA: hypothetical protein VFB73_15165 [Chloroflexota bacterium]|nr:hypothetical protein [Chloroflexota bacterium]
MIQRPYFLWRGHPIERATEHEGWYLYVLQDIALVGLGEGYGGDTIRAWADLPHNRCDLRNQLR